MHQTLEKLYTVQFGFQSNLFPHIKQELGFLTKLQQKFIEVLEVSQIDSFIPYIGKRACRPTKSRMALARCFLAKAVYNMATTEILIDHLKSDLSLRRLCGYEKLELLPSQSTFSRAFDEFSKSRLAELVHKNIVSEYLSDQLIGHVQSGFPAAIESVYPHAKIQLCIVHMIRNSVKYVTYLDRKELCGDLKMVYSAVNEKQALKALDEFKKKWDSKYPTIYKSWHKHWENLRTIFEYQDDIRKVIYTTNAIESLNSVIRKAIKNRRIFPTDNSAMKTVFLAIQSASKKCSMPIRIWKPALNCFVIEFEDRIKNV